MTFKDFWLRKCRIMNKQKKISIEENEVEEIENTVEISRPVFTEPNFKRIYEQQDYRGFEPISEIKKEFHRHFSYGKDSVKKMVYNRIPCVKWLKDYRWREYLISDLLAGLIVGLMQIPQGMAYSLLATLQAVNGLYTSFFPVLIYLYTNNLVN